jgi:HNH endonuclease
VTERQISKRLRYEVLRRDNHACRYCGASAPDAKLTVDHVVPVALGGSNEPANLVTACVDCNAGKSSSSPDQPIVDDVAADALRWAKAIEQASEALLMDHVRRKEVRDQFLSTWLNWSYTDWKTNEKVHIELPSNWANSVDTILAAGLPIEVLIECVDLAMAAKHVRRDNLFRYMCGIAWRKVAELREVAEALLEADQG